MSVVEVVDFHSLGSYLGSAVGATSHSFGGQVGLYFKALQAAPWAYRDRNRALDAFELHEDREMRSGIALAGDPWADNDVDPS